MIFSFVLFLILSQCFCSPGICRLLAGEKELTLKEVWISDAFGTYLRADAFLLFLLWTLSFFSIPYLYQGVGMFFLFVTFLFLKKMIKILNLQ